MSTKNIANFIKKIHEKPFLSGAKLRKVGDSFLVSLTVTSLHDEKMSRRTQVESNWVYTDVEKAEKSYFQRSWLCSGAKADSPLSLPSKSFVPRENLKTRSPPRPDGKWVEVVEIKVGEGKELVMDLWDEQDRDPRTTSQPMNHRGQSKVFNSGPWIPGVGWTDKAC